jgi:hypothetical protein
MPATPSWSRRCYRCWPPPVRWQANAHDRGHPHREVDSQSSSRTPLKFTKAYAGHAGVTLISSRKFAVRRISAARGPQRHRSGHRAHRAGVSTMLRNAYVVVGLGVIRGTLRGRASARDGRLLSGGGGRGGSRIGAWRGARLGRPYCPRQWWHACRHCRGRDHRSATQT